jgi:hypothetical protein
MPEPAYSYPLLSFPPFISLLVLAPTRPLLPCNEKVLEKEDAGDNGLLCFALGFSLDLGLADRVGVVAVVARGGPWPSLETGVGTVFGDSWPWLEFPIERGTLSGEMSAGWTAGDGFIGCDDEA